MRPEKLTVSGNRLIIIIAVSLEHRRFRHIITIAYSVKQSVLCDVFVLFLQLKPLRCLKGLKTKNKYKNGKWAVFI